MIRKVEIEARSPLAEYAAMPEYQLAVSELKAEAKQLLSLFQGRTLWMINSTDKGGGVAEMLPKMIQIFRELGLATEWAVIQTQEQPFFHFTKRMHNMIHAAGKENPEISKEEREVYEKVNRENADALKALLKKDDILVVHDPQPMALGSMLKQELGLPTVWRSHIGTDRDNEATQSVWKFLESYAPGYDFGVFSATEYIPSCFTGRSSLIQPAIDPLSHKNRPLTPRRLAGILSNAQMEKSEHPLVSSNYTAPAQRLQADGSFREAYLPESFGFFYRPIVTQISRWDRLKGFRPLIEAFVLLKQELAKKKEIGATERRRLEIVRLALAGPDPQSIQDDPEGQEVLCELIAFYSSLDPEFQRDIGLFALPMDSLKNNALMVNALQRCSSIIVQNSLQEGFGLTITEAMWKEKAILSTHAVGPRQQIRDALDGRLLKDPEDIEAIANALETMLGDPKQRILYGESARRHAYQNLLVFSQVGKWLRVLSEQLSA